jgi:hypothetical protein
VLNVAAAFLAGPHVNVPPTADNCKKDGWGQFTDSNGRSFKNQGDCVSFIETGGTNPAGG